MDAAASPELDDADAGDIPEYDDAEEGAADQDQEAGDEESADAAVGDDEDAASSAGRELFMADMPSFEQGLLMHGNEIERVRRARSAYFSDMAHLRAVQAAPDASPAAVAKRIESEWDRLIGAQARASQAHGPTFDLQVLRHLLDATQLQQSRRSTAQESKQPAPALTALQRMREQQMQALESSRKDPWSYDVRNDA